MEDFLKLLEDYIDKGDKNLKFIYDGSEISWDVALFIWDILCERIWADNEIELFRDYSRLLKVENYNLKLQLEGLENDPYGDILNSNNSSNNLLN